MSHNINIILIICILVITYFNIQNLKKTKNITNINIAKKKPNNIQANKIQFNYGNLRPIDIQFLNEQDHGVHLATIAPNNVIMSSSDKETKKIHKEDFIESKARFTYEFNSPRSLQMDGIIDPTDFKDGKGKSLKEVYDNYFVNYKKLVPKKELINKTDIVSEGSGAFNGNYKSFASSNIAYFLPDTWLYDNEKPENGGKFNNGLMASDPYQIDTRLATIDF
jgi:hypothetical protein